MNRNELNEMMKEYAQYKRIADEAKAEMEAIKEELTAIMEAEGIDILKGDEHKATWKEEIQRRFDSTAFKKDHEDLYESYRKPEARRTFRFS